MCEPASWTTLTYLAIASSVAAAGTSAYAAKTQSDAQTAVANSNKNNAAKALQDATSQQGAIANQQRAASTQTATQNALAAARTRASTLAAASGSNIAGISIDSIINDVSRQEATNYDALAANQSAEAEQRSYQSAGLNAQYAGRVNSVQPGGFDAAIAGLQIASAGANTYLQWKADEQAELNRMRSTPVKGG